MFSHMRSLIHALSVTLLLCLLPACAEPSVRPDAIADQIQKRIDQAENILDNVKPAVDACVYEYAQSEPCKVLLDSYSRVKRAIAQARVAVDTGRGVVSAATELAGAIRALVETLSEPSDAPDAG